MPPLVVGTVALIVGVLASAASAEHTMLPLPAPAGTEWEIIAGYNTATHSQADGNDPYAIDIVRVDGPTAGTPALAPVASTIGFVTDSCVGLEDDHGMTLLLCHLFASPGLEGGSKVMPGQRIGTVAPDGAAGNNGIAHIHLAVSPTEGGASIPLVGQYALEGIALLPLAEPNAHAGERFVSTLLSSGIPVEPPSPEPEPAQPDAPIPEPAPVAPPAPPVEPPP
ncbi:MAG TPA: hypothetical protein VNL92_05830, partial [Dehalococcoidia bacterium]|nr:hypothetical protein [Dehalococcoidia bacterium]